MASPPTAGLHDRAPTVAMRWVIRAVLAPMRAAADAASQPACPPPTLHTQSTQVREERGENNNDSSYTDYHVIVDGSAFGRIDTRQGEPPKEVCSHTCTTTAAGHCSCCRDSFAKFCTEKTTVNHLVLSLGQRLNNHNLHVQFLSHITLLSYLFARLLLFLSHLHSILR